MEEIHEEIKEAVRQLEAYKNRYRTMNTQDVIDMLKRLNENVKLTIPVVGYWVAIESTEQPEIMTDVMVKYKDGRKEVAYFDGDKRFYIEKDDRDITETIVEWHKLP